MRYVKIGLIVVAVFLIALLLTIAVRVVREVIVGGAQAMHALGNEPIEQEDAPPDDFAAEAEPLPYGQGGGSIDPDAELVEGVTFDNVVYETENLDLFEVPVDVEADMLPAGN